MAKKSNFFKLLWRSTSSPAHLFFIIGKKLFFKIVLVMRLLFWQKAISVLWFLFSGNNSFLHVSLNLIKKNAFFIEHHSPTIWKVCKLWMTPHVYFSKHTRAIQAVFVNNSRGTLWLLKQCKIQSLLLYVFSLKLSIFSLILFVLSHILYIFSLILFVFSHILYIFSLILSYSVFIFVFSLTYLAGEHRASYTVMQQI